MSVSALGSEKNPNHRHAAAAMLSKSRPFAFPSWTCIMKTEENSHMCVWLSSLKKQYMFGIRLKSSGVWLLASYYIPILQNTRTLNAFIHVCVWLCGDSKEFGGLGMFAKRSTAHL